MSRIAIITGASRGLGAELARFLAQQGYALVLTARGASDLEAAMGSFPRGSIRAIAGDVTDPRHRETLVAAARDLGGLDLLVNNASDLGERPLPALAKADLARFARTFETNVLAPLALTQAALPLLQERRGLVVNVSSDAALGGYAGWGTYGATKAALDLVSKTMADELKDKDVGVVSVDPGDMRTRMHQDAYPGVDISDRPLPEATLPFWAWLLARTPAEVSGRRYQAQSAVWEVAP
jgi:NAD(P)-dependent dehydrogenase (short-subunit alcohol dehydrogenase family)